MSVCICRPEPAPPTAAVQPAGVAVVRRRTAYALFVAAFAMGLPLPLYVDYQRVYGFATSTLTAIAATPAIGLFLALFFVGSLSDRIGRRPVLLGALATIAAGQVAFLCAWGVPALFLGRLLTGLGFGGFSGTATAALVDLDPAGDRQGAATIASVATVGGIAFGPLASGLVAQLAPAPLRLVFACELGLLATALAATLRMPAGLARRPGAGGVTLRGVQVPRRIRRDFVVAAVVGACGWACGGYFQSLAPKTVIEQLGERDRALTALIVFAFFGSSAVAQTVMRRWPVERLVAVGLASLPLGLAAIVASLAAHAPALFALGATGAGLGQGFAFLAAQAIVARRAPRDRRSETFSALLIILHVSAASAGLSVGLLTRAIPLPSAVVVYALAISAFALAAGLVWRRAAARVTQPSCG